MKFDENQQDTLNLPDVKEILRSVKSEIFSGCCFVFSGLLHQQSSFEEQEIWKLAREFGADCEYEIDDRTTHLISNRVDTEKALESKERGVPAVRPEWIYKSCKKWEKLACADFELEIGETRRKPMKRSATELEESDESVAIGVVDGVDLILDENDFEEIQKELADLEDEDDDDSEVNAFNYDRSEDISSENDIDNNSDDSNDTNIDSSTDSSTVNNIDNNMDNNIRDITYQDAELSDGDFSDLLNYSSNDDIE